MKSYTVNEVINNIIKDENSKQDKFINIDLFLEEFNLDQYIGEYFNYDKNTDLRCFRVATHICTDTEVGIKAYFLKDEFVCLTNQIARKSPEIIIGWASSESAQKTESYIKSLLDGKDEKYFDIIDMDRDFGSGYKVDYTGQMTSTHVIYKDEFCKVIEDNSKGYSNFHNIVILYKNEKITVDIRNCETPLRITENKDKFKN